MQYKHRDQSGYLLEPVDATLRRLLLPRVPQFIGTRSLTLMTIGWSSLAIVTGLLAEKNFIFIGLLTLLVILQHITDVLDGAVGRMRHSGYVQWGFYMDHLLDYVFSSCLIIAQAIACKHGGLFLILAVVQSLFFIHALLVCSLTGRFDTSLGNRLRIGITESKATLVLFYSFAAFIGPHFMVNVYYVYIPSATGFLGYLFWNQQRKLDAMDMTVKRKVNS